MSLFDRWSGRTPKKDKKKAATGEAPEEDRPLEILGDVIRAWGAASFDIDTELGATFGARAEAWAKHLLIGTPPPNARGELPEPGAPATPNARRDYGGLRRDMTSRRKSEKRFVSKTVSNLKGALLEVLDQLRGSLAADAADDQELDKQLEELKQSLDTSTLEVLREQVSGAVQRISVHVQSRRDRQDQMLNSMGARMKAMRSDLMEAQTQSTTDALTGLRNRGALDAELPKMLMMAEISRDPLSLIMLDLDHFKQLNDTHGHDGGDAVLRAFSDELIRAFPRKSDFLCRYGGEEFCIILPNANAKDALRLCDRLLFAVRQVKIPHDGKELTMTASAGVATLRHGEKAKQLLKRADKALYEAKEGGRDRAISAG